MHSHVWFVLQCTTYFSCKRWNSQCGPDSNATSYAMWRLSWILIYYIHCIRSICRVRAGSSVLLMTSLLSPDISVVTTRVEHGRSPLTNIGIGQRVQQEVKWLLRYLHSYRTFNAIELHVLQFQQVSHVERHACQRLFNLHAWHCTIAAWRLGEQPVEGHPSELRIEFSHVFVLKKSK